jgi:hypothetical protein
LACMKSTGKQSPLSEEIVTDCELRQNEVESASVVTANIDLEISSIQAVDFTSDKVALRSSTRCQDNGPEKQRYYATMIQKQWKKYLACKIFILMKRRASRYQVRAIVGSNDDDTPKNQLRTPSQEFSPWEASSAVSIQNQWRMYTRCKIMVSMRHRAFRNNALIPHDRPRLNVYIVAAIMIQSQWRKRELHQIYKQLVNMVIAIQSMLRKYWLSTGKVYTDRREVVFHSSSLGLRLQRCRDGFVRVRSVAESTSDSSLTSSSILRDGRIGIGDLVLNAVGIKLCRPVTIDQWRDVVGQIRIAPLPKTLVVTNFPSKDVIHATLVLQSRVRLWLAKCSNDKMREKEHSSTEIETPESSAYNTQTETAAGFLALSISTTETDDVANRLDSVHMEALVERELEYHNEEEEQKEDERDLHIDQDEVSTPSHHINVSLLREKFEQPAARAPTSKEKFDCLLTSPRKFTAPRFLPPSGTPSSEDTPSTNDESEARVSVAKIRQTWEVATSSPTSPDIGVSHSKVRYMMKPPEEASFKKHQKNSEINRPRGKGKKERVLTPAEKIVSTSEVLTQIIHLSLEATINGIRLLETSER